MTNLKITKISTVHEYEAVYEDHLFGILLKHKPNAPAKWSYKVTKGAEKLEILGKGGFIFEEEAYNDAVAYIEKRIQ